MNQTIQKLREDNKRKAELAEQSRQNQSIVKGIEKLDSTTVQAFSALIKFMNGHTTKAEVVNQLKSIETPDTAKAVRQLMAATNNMHATLKKKEVDLEPLREDLRGVAQSIKDQTFPEAPTSVEVSNLSELASKFDALQKSVEDLANKEVKAPDVIVKPTDVVVQPSDVNVEVDLTQLEKQLKEATSAFKGIVIPETPKTDLSKVEKELDSVKKLLKKLLEKPMGGGGGGGGAAAAYDINGVLHNLTAVESTTTPGTWCLAVANADGTPIEGGGTTPVDTDNLLLENGDALLLENGDQLLLESA